MKGVKSAMQLITPVVAEPLNNPQFTRALTITEDDTEAETLVQANKPVFKGNKKYRAKRKNGTKHFVVAFFDCDLKDRDPQGLEEKSEDTSVGRLLFSLHATPSVDLGDNGPDTSRNGEMRESPSLNDIVANRTSSNAVTFMRDLTFQSELNFMEYIEENPKKTLELFALSFDSITITSPAKYNAFIQHINNETKAFIDMKFPFYLVFTHNADGKIPCTHISNTLKDISMQYHDFKIGVLKGMIDGDKKAAYLKDACQMPHVVVFGNHFENNVGLKEENTNILHEAKCTTCQSVRRMIDYYEMNFLTCNDRDFLYKEIMNHKLLKDQYFYDAMLAYGLINVGLYSEIEGMRGRQSHTRTAVPQDYEQEYI